MQTKKKSELIPNLSHDNHHYDIQLKLTFRSIITLLDKLILVTLHCYLYKKKKNKAAPV